MTQTQNQPTLTDQERKQRIILLHCTRCNTVRKHRTLDKKGKSAKLKYISPWRGAVSGKIYTAQYRRECMTCGKTTIF